MRVTKVNKARKGQGNCQAVGCEVVILTGDSYLWWKPYRSVKRIRCLDHPPRPSETTGSESESMMLAIGEGLVQEDPQTEKDFETLVSDATDQIQNILDMIQEKMDNIEAGFGHTEIEAYYVQQEQWDAFDSWMTEVDGFDVSGYGYESDACGKCGQGQWDGQHAPQQLGDDDWHPFQEGEMEFDSETAMSDFMEIIDAGAEA